MDTPDDFAAWLATMAPPATPAEALVIDAALDANFGAFDQLPLILTLAGLQTDSAFQANLVRLEWATRLALLHARGDREPDRDALTILLNDMLATARIPLLEDPIEDVMVEPVCTPRGEYLLLTGTWEKAGYYTETVIGAFWSLPDGEPKSEALDQIFALLDLSDLLVRRAGLDRYALGGGAPQSALALPPAEQLPAHAERAFFSWQDLADAGLDVGLLAPFILHPSRFAALADREIGDSPLDFHPLVGAEEGIVVAAPGNLSTAVRARLLDAAITGGMGDRLRHHLLAAQANLVEQGGLVRARGPLVAFGDGFAREHVEAVSLGRYIHVLHVIEDFADFPRHAFAMVRDGQPAFATAIVDAIHAAYRHAAAQDDFLEGVTFLFLAGWGSGLTLNLLLPNLINWRIIVMSPHDGFVLGGCSNAALSDLFWMDRQFAMVTSQGFEFVDVNGFLNRFQLWRNTDHAFIPEHVTDCEPPIDITFGSDLLLQARREAHLAWDRRVLTRPGGTTATVMRMNPKSLFDERQPIYASYAAVQRGRIVSAVLVDDRFPVWFELELDDDTDHIGEDSFETFKAMLEWAARIFAHELSGRVSETTTPIEFRLRVEWPEGGTRIGPHPGDAEIDAAIDVVLDAAARRATITLAPVWQDGLQRPDNQAEATLAAATLRAALELLGLPPAPDGIARMRSIIGGPDVRWRHGLEAQRTVEMLKATGLLSAFARIPQSAEALVRTGIGWQTHPRSAGPVIAGKAACRTFLDAQSELLLGSLRAQIRMFRRGALVRAALEALQSASADGRHWERSARALRAIHGASNDYRVSLEQQHAINSVVRASTMIAELAIADCPIAEGRPVGAMDLAELQAHAMLYFETADLIPAIEGGRIAARFTISPTGLVMRDTSFEDRTVRRTVKVVHEALRDRAVRDYDKGVSGAAATSRSLTDDEDEPAREEASATDGDFQAAIRAEYGVSFDRFVGLARDCADLSIARRDAVLELRRSELIAALNTGAGEDVTPLIDRLTLVWRDGWETLVPGARPRDLDLSKLDRPFSPIGRPVLALDDDPNPILMVAPGVIERCIIHNLQGATTGTLQSDFWTSRAMSRYTGTRGRLEGNCFNETVADKLRTLGLTAYPSAKPSWCFNHKKTTEVEELGDLDVLALTPDGRRVWIIEAKDLKLCRTLGESARRISEYEGRTRADGKPDKMLRHLRRVAYARRHVADLARRMKLTTVPEVSGILVVRAPQPIEAMLSGADADASVVMLADLAAVPWDEGWPTNDRPDGA